MRTAGSLWASWALAALAASLIAAGAACGGEPPAPPDTSATDCAALRSRAEAGKKRWADLDEAGPPMDAPIAEGAAHHEAMAKTAKEIGADFAKLSPRRKDLAEAVEGAKMLGDLASGKLAAMAATMRELDAKITPATKLEPTANEALAKLDDKVPAEIGCGGKAPPAPCAPVVAKLAELSRARLPMGLLEAARASRGRGDALEAFAAAVLALPAAPPAQKGREATAEKARAAARAYRELVPALEAAVPVQDKLLKERQEAVEASTRLYAEMEATSRLCGPAAGASAASAKPAPTSSAGKR
jgi:hypothetical protein